MNPILLAGDSQLMWTVTLAGISIVFGVLLLLVGIFYLFGAVMKKTGRKGGKKQEAKKQPAAKAETPKASFAPKQPPAFQAAQDGVPLEVVAAITAAVAEMEGGKAFTIRSIQRRQPAGVRPVWAMAGITENTKPF